MAEKNLKRHKRRHYSPDMYGARLPYADARVLDEYAATHRMPRADVVRRGLHQFALREQLLLAGKNGGLTPLEIALAEQLSPLQLSIEEIAAELAARNRVSPVQVPTDAPGFTVAGMAPVNNEALVNLQMWLLEEMYKAVSVLMRLQINYTVAPVLDKLAAERNEDALNHYFKQANLGPEAWSPATWHVFTQTWKRVKDELKDGAARMITRKHSQRNNDNLVVGSHIGPITQRLGGSPGGGAGKTKW